MKATVSTVLAVVLLAVAMASDNPEYNSGLNGANGYNRVSWAWMSVNNNNNGYNGMDGMNAMFNNAGPRHGYGYKVYGGSMDDPGESPLPVFTSGGEPSVMVTSLDDSVAVAMGDVVPMVTDGHHVVMDDHTATFVVKGDDMFRAYRRDV